MYSLSSKILYIIGIIRYRYYLSSLKGCRYTRIKWIEHYTTIYFVTGWYKLSIVLIYWSAWCECEIKQSYHRMGWSTKTHCCEWRGPSWLHQPAQESQLPGCSSPSQHDVSCKNNSIPSCTTASTTSKVLSWACTLSWLVSSLLPLSHLRLSLSENKLISFSSPQQ